MANITDSQKQKIIIGVIVVIVLAAAWMMFGGGGGSSDSQIKTPAPAAPKVVAAAAAAHDAGGAPAQPAAAAQASGEPKQETIAISSDILKLQHDEQEAYIESLNKLQMLKLERQIAEVNQSIAATKLTTLSTERNIEDFITAKVPARKPSPGSDAPTSIPAGPPAGTMMAQQMPPPPLPQPPEEEEVVTPYSVMSIAFKNGKWRAVVADNKNATYLVSVGDKLSPDNSTVVSINKDGVELESKSGKKRTISLTTAMQ